MNGAHRKLVASLDRFGRQARGRLGRRRPDAADADLAIAAILAREGDRPLHDPAGFVGFLRDCFGATRFAVTEVRRADGEAGLPGLRFDTMLGQLSVSVPPIPEQDLKRSACRAP